MPTAFVAAAGAGRELNVFGQLAREKVTSEQSDGACYVFDVSTPPGFGVPPHTHSLEDEIIYVASGELEVTIGGEASRAGPGAVLHFARGTMHGYRNAGETPAASVWIVTPGASFQSLFRALANLPPGPPDLAALGALNVRHGIDMPPPA